MKHSSAVSIKCIIQNVVSRRIEDVVFQDFCFSQNQFGNVVTSKFRQKSRNKTHINTSDYFIRKSTHLKHSTRVGARTIRRADKIGAIKSLTLIISTENLWVSERKAGFQYSKIIIISNRNSPVTPAHTLSLFAIEKQINWYKQKFIQFVHSVGRRDYYNHLTYSKLGLKFCFLLSLYLYLLLAYVSIFNLPCDAKVTIISYIVLHTISYEGSTFFMRHGSDEQTWSNSLKTWTENQGLLISVICLWLKFVVNFILHLNNLI